MGISTTVRNVSTPYGKGTLYSRICAPTCVHADYRCAHFQHTAATDKFDHTDIASELYMRIFASNMQPRASRINHFSQYLSDPFGSGIPPGS